MADDVMSGAPPLAPLYDPRFEHDACGVGFVAETRAGPSRRIVDRALEALAGLTHRGALAADAQTGDGAGLAIPIPRLFIRALLDELGRAEITPDRVALGMVFLPSVREDSEIARRHVEAAVLAEGLAVIGWRDVPIDPGVLGPAALASMPRITQVLVSWPRAMGPVARERSLFFARRAAEFGAIDGLPAGSVHVASLSARTVVYKGLFVGGELGRFYLDLAHPAMAARYATFHQRYSTNTHPSWRLAQPFRFIAHNGEINTLRGNRESMRGRAASLGGGELGRRLARDVAAGLPILDPAGSDSTSLDEALELLVLGGLEVPEALARLLPESLALRSEPARDDALAGWQRGAAQRIEPWDGPAALVFADGRSVGAVLDRNGLRPAAWETRADGFVVLASEAGVLHAAADEITGRGRLGPGEMFIVDTLRGHILDDASAKAKIARHGRRSASRGSWGVSAGGEPRPALPAAGAAPAGVAAVAGAVPNRSQDELHRLHEAFGLDAEQLRVSLRAMALTGREAMWSMGDDTPLAIAARRPRAVAAYLRQAFAQVTNPPIDPERERAVMTLGLPLGRRLSLLGGVPSGVDPIRWLEAPILDPATWLDATDTDRRSHSLVLAATWMVSAGPAALEVALDRLAATAVRASLRGTHLIVLDDRGVDKDRAPIPSLLAVGAVHAALLDRGLRDRTDIAVAAGDAFDVHGMAMLIAAGASAVHPWLALETAAGMAGGRGAEELTSGQAIANLLAALDHGLRKVLARMGISTLASYRGAQLFDIIGLAPSLAARCFPAAPLRAGTVGVERLAAEALDRHAQAHRPAPEVPESAARRGAPPLGDPGRVRFRSDGELHVFAPAVVRATQALASGASTGSDPTADLAVYRAATARSTPALVRDLLDIAAPPRPLPVSEVESGRSIVRRFVSSAMSLGSLSPEAHQALAIGMRRLGGASNTGEGGEDPSWYEPAPDGELRESAIKQVASARFGVTAEYLARAEQLEIKMAQGSKPGEGGQLPARKATPLIAALRRGQVGMTYISPPPHHDIYSIEDLAQLIADLRAINPTARIGVKLVATAGVGTIAAGVAKAHADYVLISGHAGGTGASPLSSIHSVGAPWELGLAEAHQVLVRQGLRDRVALRVDGGLQTGRDVVIAALLGAEEFGFGTAALVALGCDMARQCHLDTCPTGIATQREDLRAKFTGTPESVVRFFTALAEDVRAELAALGLCTLEEAIGRSDLLAVGEASPLDLAALTAAPPWAVPLERRGRTPRDRGRIVDAPPASRLDGRLATDAAAVLGAGRPAVLAALVTTAERAVGASISGMLARDPSLRCRAVGEGGVDGGPIVTYRLAGSAGQSVGAFVAQGIRIDVTGIANDYVAKGLSGGVVVVRPPDGVAFEARAGAIAGNTCLYGATSGRLHLVGRAGMRFAVRNSGAVAVVEGVGAHGCEYMTGGTVVVLGPVGRNFGAGMTGGRAFVWDEEGELPGRVNRESVTAVPVASLEGDRSCDSDLRDLVGLHAAEGSRLAAKLLADWTSTRSAVWLVEPVSV